MKLPIALGFLTNRLDNIVQHVKFDSLQTWEFMPVNNELFPAINLAKSAVKESATHPCVMNVANEICVDLFLNKNYFSRYYFHS